MNVLVLACYLVSFIIAGRSGEELYAPAVHGSAFDVDLYGNMFILDAGRNTVKLVSKEGAVVREIGGAGWQDGQFDRPAGIWARNGIDVFVADYGNHRIERFDRNLNFVSTLFTRDRENPDERFGYPSAVALSSFGDLFLCDTENSRILKVSGFSNVEQTFGGFGAGRGRLEHPTQLEIGPGDNVYVLDGRRVVVFDSFGNYVGDLLGGMFKGPTAIFADQQSAAVLDDGTIYCFDQADRPTARIPIASIHGLPEGDILSILFSGGQLYVLTTGGMFHAPDPRASYRLDKEENSR